MSPSVLFWIDILANLTTAIVAMASLVLLIGTGARRRTNQNLGLFMAAILLWVVSSLVLRSTLWFDFGDSLQWMELSIAGFGFVGPTLFLFAITYVGSERRGFWLLAGAGLLGMLILMLPLFSHQVISDVYLGQYDLVNWHMTGFGTLAALVPFAFEALTLFVFWQHRQQLGEPALIVSVAIMLIGGVIGASVRLPFPTISVTATFSITVLGYAVMRRQLFNPLRTLTQQLETQVDERTRELQQTRNRLQRLNEQQRIVAEINREIAQAITPAKMLDILVDRVHNRLGYHHIYVYQLDKTSTQLTLKAAAGTTAKTVLAKGHRLKIDGSSLIGQTAIQQHPRIAEARDDDVAYFGDTVLPGARAEMILPLRIGDRLLGVLDFQSIHFEAFADDDLAILTALTDQVAVTLDNARLLQETENALAEVEKVQRQYLHQAWQAATGELERVQAYTYDDGDGVTPISLSTAWSPEVAQVAQQRVPRVNQSTVTLPILLRDQVIGALRLHHKPDQAWESDDIEALEAITERLALALENARLFQEAQVRATHERLIGEVTEQMQRATNLEALMRITTEELNKVLGASRTYVRLSMEAELTDGWETTEKPETLEDIASENEGRA